MKARIDGDEVAITVVEKSDNGEFKVTRNDTGQMLTVTNDQLIEEPQSPLREPFKDYDAPEPTSAPRDPFKNYEPEEPNFDLAVLGGCA